MHTRYRCPPRAGASGGKTGRFAQPREPCAALRYVLLLGFPAPSDAAADDDDGARPAVRRRNRARPPSRTRCCPT